MSDTSSGPDLFNELAHEFAERCRRGERPPLTEYTDKHPELAEQIRELFPALVELEQVGSVQGPPTGPNFAPAAEGGAPPRQLGEYHILREVGRGGMGVVYEAVQESLGRHVALKVLPPQPLMNPTYLERFRREARAAARLHHTNIVPVFGVGEADGVHYYAMQFIQGQGLHEVLKEVKQLRGQEGTPTDDARHGGDLSVSIARGLLSGQFQSGAVDGGASPGNSATRTPQDGSTSAEPRSGSGLASQPEAQYFRSVALVGVQVAEGLAYAHRQRILHRDIKPSNLLLDARGTAWVTDFGLAKEEGVEELTQSGDLVGTLRYMAPERFEGKADARSDVYGLGVTLYELLTLRPAFDDTNRGRLIERVLHEEPARLRRLDPHIPRDLETIVLKAIAKDLADRYATAEALAEDLRRFLADRLILARRVSVRERAWRWCRRNPALAVASGLAVASLVAVAIVSISFGIYQSRAATDLRQALGAKEETAIGLSIALGKNEEITTNLRTTLGRNEEITKDLLREQRQTKATLASMALDRGVSLSEQGDPGRGMLWLARGLEYATAAEDVDLQRVLRRNLGGWYRRVHSWRAAFPHSGPVMAAAFSPDGKIILTGCADKVARLWDVATGKQVGPTLQHQGEVRAVAFSPDGKIILTGSFDHTARLWDAATGKPLGPPLPHDDKVFTVAFSPDGKTIVTGGDDRTIRLWEAVTGKPISLRFYNSEVSPHQEFLRGGTVCAVAFSPDGKTILTGSADGKARLWDLSGDRFLSRPPMQHSSSVWAVAFSPDGKTVLTGSHDFTARLWETATGRPIGPALQHQHTVHAVAFSPDGRTVATGGGNDRTARLWDAATGKPLGPPLQHQATVFSATFSPDGKTLLTADGGHTARLWDVADQFPGTSLPHQGTVLAMAFSRDGKMVVTGIFKRGEPRTVLLWDTATGKPTGEPPDYRSRILGVAVSPDGGSILTGGNQGTDKRDYTARLWDATTGKPIGLPLQHRGVVDAVAFSPDGKTVLTGSGDSTAQLWDAATGKPIGPPLNLRGMVTAVAFSSDGKAILTGYTPKTARLWDVATREPLGPPLPHEGNVHAVAISPDGKILLTGSEDGTARLWEAATGKPIGPPLRHQGAVRAVAFSPDGKTVLTGSADMTVRLWDAATGRQIGPPLHHPGFVHAVAFTPDGKTALSGSDNRIGRLDVAAAVQGDVERITLWVQVMTGMELGEDGIVRTLEGRAQPGRARLLEELGGPPLPELTGTERSASPEQVTAWHFQELDASEKTGQWAAAVFHLDHLIKTEPANWQLHNRRGWARLQLGQLDPAITDFTRAIEMKPNEWTPWFRRGQVRMRARLFDGAIGDFTQTVELQPKYVEAYHQRGHAHESQGQLQRALDDYGAALQLQDKAAHLYVDRGRIHSRLGMAERALSDYTQATRLQPNYAPAQNGLAWLLATCPDPKLRDPALAVRLAHRAVELTPKSGVYWNTLGVAQYRAGDWKAAIAALEKSMALRNGGDSSDWFFLAMAHGQLGDPEQARKWYDQAVQGMDKNQPKNEELRRFRAEAAELLGIKEPPQ